MANDPPPPPPPQFFSPRNEQKGFLRDDGMVEIDAQQVSEVWRFDAPHGDTFNFRDRSSDNEVLFIQCMPDATKDCVQRRGAKLPRGIRSRQGRGGSLPESQG